MTKKELEQENFQLKAHIEELKNSLNPKSENEAQPEAQLPKFASTDYSKLIDLSTQLNDCAVHLNHLKLKIGNNPKSAGLLKLEKEDKRYKGILSTVLTEIEKF